MRSTTFPDFWPVSTYRDGLDDVVQRVRPVDDGAVPARLDELLDEQQVVPAVPADAERPALAPDDPRGEREERHVVEVAEVHRDVDPTRVQ